MKKTMLNVLFLLVGFSVFAQYNTAYDINRIGDNTGRIADSLERQNRQAAATAAHEDRQRHAEWFYREIQTAVPDYRRIMSEQRFINAIQRDNLTYAFDPISVSWVKVKLGKKHVKRPVYQKNNPNMAIKLLLDYKKYEKRVAEQKRAAEQKETTVKIPNGNIIQSQGFKNWLRNKPIYARIIRENKNADEVNQVIDEYKSYAGLK